MNGARPAVPDRAAAARAHFSPRVMVRGLGWDVGLPLVAHYALHLLGASDWVALRTASSAAALRIVWVAVRDRRLNLFAVIMLVVFGVGLALAFVGGDPRFLLPVRVMVALSQVMMIAAFVLLIAWTSWYVRRATARGV